MIFGRMQNFGREFVLVGLDMENLREMCNGKPLVIGPVPNDPLLANVQLIIVVGENNEAVYKQVESLTAPPPQPPGN